MKFIGHQKGTNKLQAFDFPGIPTEQTHGKTFSYVVGPFKTRRAQKWAASCGFNNPHFQHVEDAERISKVN